MSQFVSRAGQKLDFALDQFQIDVTGWVCSDLGCNVGGFVDCLLLRGAKKIYAVDTGYGALEWKLRKDPRVVVMERTNAMHVSLPEPMNLVTIDVAWTRQRHILPSAKKLLAANGQIVSLIKPHYEAEKHQLKAGVLVSEELDSVLNQVKADVLTAGLELKGLAQSPILGTKGNREFLAWIEPSTASK